MTRFINTFQEFAEFFIIINCMIELITMVPTIVSAFVNIFN